MSSIRPLATCRHPAAREADIGAEYILICRYCGAVRRGTLGGKLKWARPIYVQSAIDESKKKKVSPDSGDEEGSEGR